MLFDNWQGFSFWSLLADDHGENFACPTMSVI
jgi:hypothetical protein